MQAKLTQIFLSRDAKSVIICLQQTHRVHLNLFKVLSTSFACHDSQKQHINHEMSNSSCHFDISASLDTEVCSAHVRSLKRFCKTRMNPESGP